MINLIFGAIAALLLIATKCQASCPLHPIPYVPPVFLSTQYIYESANHPYDSDPKEVPKIYPPKKTEKFMPPCCGFKAAPCTESIYRRLDGSCTNLQHPEWGVPNSTYIRLLPSAYADGICKPRQGVNGNILPSARLVRTSLFANGQVENPFWPILAMQWGQFMAHDMSLLKQPEELSTCCTDDKKRPKKTGQTCFPIKIPLNDPVMGKAGITCMNFTRTITDRDLGCSKGNEAAQQINVVTSFMDLSNVYGLDDEMNRGLRTMNGGRLITEIRNNRIYPPHEPNIRGNCPCNLASENACYKTGDSRSNQSPQLAILQTIFIREHNRITKELEKINPHWNDERLFQEARRILIAAYQRISYYEWMPIFFGSENIADNGITFNNTGFVNDYDSNVDPTISQENAHAAYRYFHTNIVGKLNLLNENRETASTIPINGWFNRPQILEDGNNIEQLTMGMITQNLEETDDFFVEEITDKLFTCPGVNLGIDLRATDFQRDRDHGLNYYNNYRKYCGLKEAKSWNDYSDLIEPDNIEILKKLYKSYKDVDLSVGGSLEELAPGAQAGPTFLCILNDQFRRTRRADRFFFENSGSGFTQAQLNEIRKASVSRMICDNGDGIKDTQPLGFVLRFPGFNEVTPCEKIPSINLAMWKELCTSSK